MRIGFIILYSTIYMETFISEIGGRHGATLLGSYGSDCLHFNFVQIIKLL